jgi:acyl-coenzyme A synthetase/AMP-(fatty) acid ligase
MHGCASGSRVAIIGSMGPDAVATYLAVVWLGAAVVSVAESFSAEETRQRLQLAATTLVIVQVKRPPASPLLPHCMLYPDINITLMMHLVIFRSSEKLLRDEQLLWRSWTLDQCKS